MPVNLFRYSLLGFATLTPLAFTETKTQLSRSLVHEFVQTEQIKSKEWADWKNKEQILSDMNLVLKKEKEALENKLKLRNQNLSKSDQERAKWIRIESQLQEKVDLIQSFLKKNEPKLIALENKLPPLLLKELKSNFSKLKNQAEEATLGERAQMLVSLMISIQEFDKKVSLGYEVLKDDHGKEVEVKVLYLGLTSAYYISNNGALAGFGHGHEATWKWVPTPKLKATIEKAFNIYQSKLEEATFLPLPVKGGAS